MGDKEEGARSSSLRQRLKDGEVKIGIWGLGYIGYSSMAYFAKAGVHCLGTDVIKKRVDDINTAGKCVIPNMDYWLAFDVVPLIKAKLMSATLDWSELIDDNVPVHLISVPTERGGKPYDDILIDVFEKISRSYSKKKAASPPLVIIESTLTPSRVDNLIIPLIEKKGLKVGKDLLLGVAPRRDWFVSPDKTLETLPRIIGATNSLTVDLVEEVLGIICKNLIRATDHNHACIVKSVENAFRQLNITFANQLSLAYPHLNITEILKLAGTKWNVGVYHPSFGTGGYCIPLAPQYVLEGAKHPEELTLLKASLETDFSLPQRVAHSLKEKGLKNIGILGLAYVQDIKVHTLSPTIAISKELKGKRVNVKVHDPLFSPEEIFNHTGCETFEFPEGMNQFDGIILVSGHMLYKFTPHKKIFDNLQNCRLILDNMGFWKEINFQNIEYHEAGDAFWLGKK